MNELGELAAGRWAAWHGLEECDIASADAQLGPPLEDELHGGMFGGEPAQFRRYSPTGASPQGITVWVLGDLVIGVELGEPEPPTGTLDALGPPELVLESGLGWNWTQEVWASRGLVVHRREDRIRVAFGLAPIDPDEWPSDPLSSWRIERIPR